MLVDIQSAVSLLRDGGTVALLLLILVGGFRRWWVFGHHYEEALAREAKWRELALASHGMSKRAVDALVASTENQ